MLFERLIKKRTQTERLCAALKRLEQSLQEELEKNRRLEMKIWQLEKENELLKKENKRLYQEQGKFERLFGNSSKESAA